MQPFFIVADADGGVEELAEAGCGKEFVAWAIAHDAAVAHEDDALDFRKDVAEVMGDEDEAGAFGGEPAEGFSELALGGEVEGVGGLVEEELAGTMDEGARDEDAALFSRGHFADQACGEVRGFHAGEGFSSAGAHFSGDVEIGPEGGGGEEAGDDGVEAGGDGGALAGQIGADHAEVATQLGEVPAIAAKDTDVHAGLNDGIDLAGDGENQRRLAAAIGAEDGDMLACADGEMHVMKDDAIAARDIHVGEFEKMVRIGRSGDFVGSMGEGFHIC